MTARFQHIDNEDGKTATRNLFRLAKTMTEERLMMELTEDGKVIWESK